MAEGNDGRGRFEYTYFNSFCTCIVILGFGKFNLKVTALGALIYTNVVISITSTGFILPAAACDFEMATIDKGRIVIAPVLGISFKLKTLKIYLLCSNIYEI